MPDTQGQAKKKILIVDDDASLRQLYGFELGKSYEILEAVDGEEGLAKAKIEKPDLILLDIMMPKFDGIAYVSKIKEDADLANIPIIMLTNFGQENLIQQAFNLGVNDYLLKYKITPEEMLEKISQVLGTSAPPQL